MVDSVRPHPPAPSPIGDGEKESGRKDKKKIRKREEVI